MTQTPCLNELPLELLENIFCYLPSLHYLIPLSQTNQRLRSIAKARYEEEAHKMWPSMDKKEYIPSINYAEQMRQKHDTFAPLEPTEIPKDRIHTNEPVPEEAVLLRDSMQTFDGFYLDFRASTMIAVPRYAYPGGWNPMWRLAPNSGQTEDRVLVQHEQRRRIWSFYMDNMDEENAYRTKAAFDEWLYVVFQPADGSTIVVKHHCMDDNNPVISDKPDYEVELEPFVIDGIFYSPVAFPSADGVVVSYRPELDHITPIPGLLDYLYLVDMETGHETFLTQKPVKMNSCSLSLDGISLYGKDALVPDFHGNAFEIIAGTDHWQRMELPGKPPIDENYAYSMDEQFRKGYHSFDGKKVVDMANRKSYELPYEGKCAIFGLLNGELHWWTFPEAHKRVDSKVAIFSPVDMCLPAEDHGDASVTAKQLNDFCRVSFSTGTTVC
ncbi:hypothetical protein CJU89_1225 [Yarrowia sp. B02]|nr:hypothetical protein CJU89_1225 [Yarrowia sp. B02]